MARVKLIVDREDVAPEHHALFDALAARRGRISGPSTVVLHSPGLARPWNEISEYLHRESIVEPEHAELAVCATAREKDCGYIWNAHVPLARKAGLAADTIDAVRDRRPVAGLPDSARAVVLYVRQLLQHNRVESAVFDQLLKAHDPRWLVELTVWIGRYKDCPYVWAAHAPAARKAGASAAAVTAVRDRGDLTSLPAAERDIVDYVRQLLRTNRVTQALFDRLRDQHGVRGLVDLTALIGHYGIVTGILNAFEVAPAADAEPLPLGSHAA